MAEDIYIYHRLVAFADTDAMGVVHHANYLRYFEEARVAWMRAKGLIGEHYPYSQVCLAVLESTCRHERGLKFDEELKIAVIVRRERLKIRFRYAIYSLDGQHRIATGETVLVPVDKQIKPVRLNKVFSARMENQLWIETWPSNLLESPSLQP